MRSSSRSTSLRHRVEHRPVRSARSTGRKGRGTVRRCRASRRWRRDCRARYASRSWRGHGEVVGLAQIDFLVRHIGQRRGPVRPPASFAERRELGRRTKACASASVLIIGAMMPSAPKSSARLAVANSPSGMRTIGAAPPWRTCATAASTEAVSHRPCCPSRVTAESLRGQPVPRRSEKAGRTSRCGRSRPRAAGGRARRRVASS